MTARQTNHTLSNRMKEGIEAAQARLATLEKEAQKVVSELVSKGKASRKDVEELVARFNPEELLEVEVVKDIQGKAKHLASDLSHRIEEVREKVVTFAGVASREQVEDISKELDRLSRKLDKLTGKKASTPKAE